jgi:hypothetical protein
MRRFPSLTKSDLVKAGRSVLALDNEKQFRIPQKYEKLIQYVLLGCLQTIRGNMEIEYKVESGLIDYRYHAPHSTLVELVTIRKGGYGVEHLVKRNVDELKKLSQFPSSKVRTRYLLILDFFHSRPLNKEKLQDTYNKYWTILGRYLRRHSNQREMERITVVYLHLSGQFHFTLKKQKLKH